MLIPTYTFKELYVIVVKDLPISPSMKALSAVDMTDLEWRRKYGEMEARFRDLKEELELMAARNKNGR